MPRRLATGLLLLMLLSSPHAATGDEPSMRVVVRVVTQMDQQLLSRVQGQVADLDVTLVPVTSRSLGASGHARFEQARRHAREHRARIVVWFEPAGPHGRRVHIAEPGKDTLFVRRVSTKDASARAEAIAIVVRSSLRALAMGGRIGVRVPSAVTTPRDRAPDPAPRRRDRGWRWSLGVQGQMSFDGAASPGQSGFAGRVEVGRKALALGVVGVAGLSTQLSDTMSIVHLARHRLGVGAALRIAGTGRTLLRVVGDVGVVAYTRSTTVLGDGLTATDPATTWAGFGSVALRGQWRPMASQPMWLTLEAGAAAVLGAPEFRYQLGQTTIVRDRLWPIQPRVGLGVRLEGL